MNVYDLANRIEEGAVFPAVVSGRPYNLGWSNLPVRVFPAARGGKGAVGNDESSLCGWCVRLAAPSDCALMGNGGISLVLSHPDSVFHYPPSIVLLR